MAHRAGSLKPEIARARRATVFPLQNERPLRNLEIIGKVKHDLGAVYRDIKIRTAKSYSFILHRSREAAGNLKDGVQRARRERPLYIVAAVAGTAFALGVVLRIWRSRHE